MLAKWSLIFSLVAPVAHSAILVEDPTVVVPENSAGRPVKKVVPRQSFRRSASSAFELRKTHRAGVGLIGGGNLGLGGAAIELNLTKDNSLMVGFGGGPEYSSFNVQWKRLITGKSLMPYAGIGYARWYSVDEVGSPDAIRPSIIRKKLMAKNDLEKDGKLGLDLLTPALGVQYVQLHGPWTGLSLGIEVNLLFSLQRFSAVPSGALTTFYYF